MTLEVDFCIFAQLHLSGMSSFCMIQVAGLNAKNVQQKMPSVNVRKQIYQHI